MHKKEANLSSRELKQISNVLTQLIEEKRENKQFFLVKKEDSLIPYDTRDFSYFNIKSGIVSGVTLDNEIVVIDKKMKELEAELNANHFFRINRKFIVQISAITKINDELHGKLSITVSPMCNKKIIISKLRSKDFINWMLKC